MCTLTINTGLSYFSYFTDRNMLAILSEVVLKTLPKAVIKAKVKPGESFFRCDGAMLPIKWYDKRAITVISTIHEATKVVKKSCKAHRENIKPYAISSCTILMSQVDLSNQYLAS